MHGISLPYQLKAYIRALFLFIGKEIENYLYISNNTGNYLNIFNLSVTILEM